MDLSLTPQMTEQEREKAVGMDSRRLDKLFNVFDGQRQALSGCACWRLEPGDGVLFDQAVGLRSGENLSENQHDLINEA